MDRQEFLQLQASGAIPRASFGVDRGAQEEAVRRYFERRRGAAPAATGGAASGGAGGAVPTIGDSGGNGVGGESGLSPGGAATGYDSTPGALVDAGGKSISFDASKAAKVMGLLGLPGLAFGLSVVNQAPVHNAVAPVSVDSRGQDNVGYFGDPGYSGAGFSSVGGTFGSDFGGPGLGANTDSSGLDSMGGYGGDLGGVSDGVGPGSDANTDASSAGATNGSDAQSDAAAADAASSASDSASDGDSGDGDSGDGGWAKGGRVTRKKLIGPDPKGRDEGYGALDHNEFVIKESTAKRLGFRKLEALNNGKAKIVMIGAKK